MKEAMSYQTITVEKRGAADWLTLNRPDVFNALSLQMVEELSAYFGALLQRPRDAGGG